MGGESAPVSGTIPGGARRQIQESRTDVRVKRQKSRKNTQFGDTKQRMVAPHVTVEE
jgi:hypothetical protein